MRVLETITVDRDGGVVTITFNRPKKKNAVTSTTWDEMLPVLQEAAVDPEVRVLVLTGAEGNFCSGADLTSLDASVPAVTGMRTLGDTLLRLHRLPKPTLAKVDGVATGIGLSMALACDLVVASDRARFSAIFARRGLALDGGASWTLPRLVGMHKAKELSLFGDIFGADEAERLGIVNVVVPVAELDKVADEWVQRLANGPTLALSLTKAMLNNAFAISMDEALENEARSQHVTFTTADTAAAMRAFLAKEEPVFKGR